MSEYPTNGFGFAAISRSRGEVSAGPTRSRRGRTGRRRPPGRRTSPRGRRARALGVAGHPVVARVDPLAELDPVAVRLPPLDPAQDLGAVVVRGRGAGTPIVPPGEADVRTASPWRAWAANLPAFAARSQGQHGRAAPVDFGPVRVARTSRGRSALIENVWVTLSDGIRLAARIWLPEDAERGSGAGRSSRHSLPEGRLDGTARRAATPVRRRPRLRRRSLDLRGTASRTACSSTSTCRRSRTTSRSLAWLAEQPWCTGAVGMTGISWGGFNGLQVAARRPPALKAIMTLCSTDDRYADDVHYIGGCVLAIDALPWASPDARLERGAARPALRR